MMVFARRGSIAPATIDCGPQSTGLDGDSNNQKAKTCAFVLGCRDDEVRRVIRVLCRRTKNNPVLIGEPGVGKTAIVEGLAQRVVKGDIPSTLKVGGCGCGGAQSTGSACPNQTNTLISSTQHQCHPNEHTHQFNTTPMPSQRTHSPIQHNTDAIPTNTLTNSTQHNTNIIQMNRSHSA